VLCHPVIPIRRGGNGRAPGAHLCARRDYDGRVTDVLRVDPRYPDPAHIARAADCLRAGGLVAFPTETVYGLGVHALDSAAVRRLFEAKGRPAADPLIVHVLSLDDAEPLVRAVPGTARVLAERFWPGPLTMVMRRAAIVPDEVTAGLDTVAVRVPSHPVARALIAQARLPVAAPSANQFSRPSPTRAEHVLEDLAGRIDLILDGGPTTVGIESTVLDLSRGAPTILRPGAVSAEMLGGVLGGVGATGAPPSSGSMRSPGLLEKHYSPRAPLTLYEGSRDAVLDRMAADARASLGRVARIGVILAEGDAERLGPAAEVSDSRLHIRTLGKEDDLDVVAARLYETLRDLDSAGVDAILVRSFAAESGLGVAVHDRLRRAAAGRVVQC
jgi:L-threonylcarbamoyladenylate synthase